MSRMPGEKRPGRARARGRGCRARVQPRSPGEGAPAAPAHTDEADEAPGHAEEGRAEEGGEVEQRAGERLRQRQPEGKRLAAHPLAPALSDRRARKVVHVVGLLPAPVGELALEHGEHDLGAGGEGAARGRARAGERAYARPEPAQRARALCLARRLNARPALVAAPLAPPAGAPAHRRRW